MVKFKDVSLNELPRDLRGKRIEGFFVSERDVKERIKNHLKKDGWKELLEEDWKCVFASTGRSDWRPDVMLKKDNVRRYIPERVCNLLKLEIFLVDQERMVARLTPMGVARG